MALVDLGLALMDASPEECEDELRRLHITLESMVGSPWFAASAASCGAQQGPLPSWSDGTSLQGRCDSICTEVW